MVRIAFNHVNLIKGDRLQAPTKGGMATIWD